LTTSDGRSIDEGTPTEDAYSIDAEDHAVLFEIERLRAQATGTAPISLARYDCVMIDEAQEFAALELALIGRTVFQDGSLIVAGDAAQQVDPASFFVGWERVMQDLAAERHTRAVLDVNYRCPPDVTALARSIIDPALPGPSPHPTIAIAPASSVFHQATWLGAALRDVQRLDWWASIAIICRTAEGARAFARGVRHQVTPRLALDGLFDFKPGLILTCVAEVKGLEFDLIIVPDATASTFPDTGDSRRALYVGVTRTTHRLTLGAPGALSPLIRV
jgi:DNA helicase IV